jgi:hypothetical protein
MGVLILWLMAIGFTIPLAILRGYIIVCMWDWFVLTQFPQAPHISIAGAIGLSYLAYMFYPTAKDEDKEKEDAGEAIVKLFVHLIKGGILSLVMWGIAAIVHCYM